MADFTPENQKFDLWMSATMAYLFASLGRPEFVPDSADGKQTRHEMSEEEVRCLVGLAESVRGKKKFTRGQRCSASRFAENALDAIARGKKWAEIKRQEKADSYYFEGMRVISKSGDTGRIGGPGRSGVVSGETGFWYPVYFDGDHSGTKYWKKAECMKPAYDGRQVGTWEMCRWKPNEQRP